MRHDHEPIDAVETGRRRLRRAVDALDAVVERIARPRQRRDADDLRRRGGLSLVSRHALLFARMRLGAADEGTGAPEASGGKVYPWIVWAGLMVGTGIATASLLDLVDPWIPAGEQHRLISALFIVIVWPTLMWCLPLLLKRRFPV
jgi:hypothetical protein